MRYISNLEFSFFSSNCVVGAICALGLLVFMVGCDSAGVNTVSVLPQTEEAIDPHFAQPSVVDGRIAFDDFDEFRDFMGSIINKEDSHLDSVQAAINFTSLRSDTERLADEVGKDIEELEVVEDPFFATALNSDGEFQVEGMVYKITKNYVYRVPKESVDRLSFISLRNHDQVVLTQKTTSDPVLEIFEVERANADLVNKSGSFIRSMVSCSQNWGDRRRIKGQAWFTNWRVYMSATTEIESQRKSWFRWWHNRIESVSLNANYSITQTFRPAWGGYEYTQTTTDSYSHTKYNAAEIRKNLTWGVSYNGVIRVKGWISSNYSGTRSFDNQTRSCSTYISK